MQTGCESSARCRWEPKEVLKGYEAEVEAYEMRCSIWDLAQRERQQAVARPGAGAGAELRVVAVALLFTHKWRGLLRLRELPSLCASGVSAGPGGAARQFDRTPEWLSHAGELHRYQLDGLNWLLRKWQSKENVILADEVGER